MRSPGRLIRLLKLSTVLQTGRQVPAHDLTEKTGTGRRTVFRDLNLLRPAGIPVHYDPQQHTYRFDHNFFPPPVNLTAPEALSLMMLVRKHVQRMRRTYSDRRER